ncbi:hypothetical protein IQ65_07900 [Leptospira interrogans serovar Lai]|nr:hypothetical protein IQ65_07900 [Leptospira interrogans serovar Lai]
MWELPQTLILQIHSKSVGTTTNIDFTDQFYKCGNYHKHRFYGSILQMWELPQTPILQISSKNVGTTTFKKFFFNRIYVKLEFIYPYILYRNNSYFLRILSLFL